MKKRDNEKFNRIFIYALGVIGVACAFLCVLLNFGAVSGFISRLVSAFKPVVYAVIFVFCVGGIVNMYSSFFEKHIAGSEKSALAAKVISVTLGYLTFLLIIAALLIIVFLPLVSSYSDILTRIPEYLTNAKAWVRGAIDSIPILSEQSDKIMEYINESLNFSYDSIQKYAPVFMDIINKLVSEASNMLLGLIISIYIICSGKFIERVKDRLVHAFLSEEKAKKVHSAIVTVYGYFADFFSGRLLYSLIIGIVFYIVLWAMNIPLYSFISIMIGVLVFVPVIGTVLALGLSLFFVFITSYRMSLWFLVLFCVVLLSGYLVLQKYIIKKSVRTTVTASLVSVLVLYGLLGTTGAVLGVPLYLSCKLAAQAIISSLENRRERQDAKAADDDSDILE